MNGDVLISQMPSNQSFTTTGVVCYDTNPVVELTASEPDVQYRLYRDGIYTNRADASSPIQFDVSDAGTYTVVAVTLDNNNNVVCSRTLNDQLTVENPAVFSLSAVGGITSYCQGVSPTGIDLQLSGSQNNVTYRLANTVSGIISGTAQGGNGSPLIWSDVTAGTYYVVAETANGCTKNMGNVVITEAPLPSAIMTTSTPNSRCEGTSVDFYINISFSGNQPFSFDITNNAGDPPITVNDHYSNTYSVQVNPSTDITYTLTNLVDGSGCDPVLNAGQVQFYVRPNPVFTFDASPNGVSTSGGIPSTNVCLGSQVTLEANVSNTSGPYSYFWSNSLGTTQSVSFYPNTTRTYDATVINEYGCTTTRQIEVVVDPLPIVDFEPENGDYEVCINGGDIELSPTAPNTGGDFTGTGVSGNFFDPAVAGVGRHPITYSFTNTTTGCENSITKDIDVNPEPNVDVQGNQTIYCAGAGVVTIYGSPQNSNGVWTIVGGGKALVRGRC
jgi:hypothetical protein